MPTAEESKIGGGLSILAEFLCMHGTYSLTGGRAVPYTAESSMAYQVLRRHKHPLFPLDGRTRGRCNPEATRPGNRRTAQEAAEEAPASTDKPYSVVTATGKVTQSPQRLVGGLDKCAAFARRARSRGAAPSHPIRWSREVCDDVLGLMYYDDRYCASQGAEWLSRDILPPGKSLHLYAYPHDMRQHDYLGALAWIAVMGRALSGATMGTAADDGMQLAFNLPTGSSAPLTDVDGSDILVSAAFGAVLGAFGIPGVLGTAVSVTKKVVKIKNLKKGIDRSEKAKKPYDQLTSTGKRRQRRKQKKCDEKTALEKSCIKDLFRTGVSIYSKEKLQEHFNETPTAESKDK